MTEGYPNHLKSIPRSVGSLKHYFDVHDQPFSRSIIYLVILALLVTVVGMAVGIVGFVREAGKQAKALEAELAGMRFEGGKLAADAAEQPCVLWEDVRTVTIPTKGKDGKTRQEERRIKRMIVVLDTTGGLDSLEKATELAGCAEPARYVFFGAEEVESIELPKSRAEQPKTESIAYSDEKKLAELRQLVEANGGTMPALTVKDDVATFDLPPDKVHMLVRTPAVMVLVDTSGKKRSMNAAVGDAFNSDPDFRAKVERPEFLLFLSATAATLKPAFVREATTWTFAEGDEVSPRSLAAWAAGAARGARVKATLRQALPWFLYGLVILFVGALICSVPGLIVSGSMRAGLAYGELLTVAIYAITPALAVFLLAIVVLQGQGSPWILGLALIIGMVYAALGTHRTAQGIAEEGSPTI